MTNIAAECIKNPGKKSVWSPQQRKYICPERGRRKHAAAVSPQLSVDETAEHPPISPQFKLVFITGRAVVFFEYKTDCNMPFSSVKMVIAFRQRSGRRRK
jgi:hypothetical protein